MSTAAKKIVSVSPATSYLVRHPTSSDWADIFIRLLPGGDVFTGGGVFTCISSYGRYNHVWGHIGEQSFYQFLCQLDMDYFLKKTRPGDFTRFSLEKSCKAVQSNILEARKNSNLTREDARDFWRATMDACDSCSSPSDFLNTLDSYDVISELYGGVACAVPIVDDYREECVSFWQRLWPLITNYWREESM